MNKKNTQTMQETLITLPRPHQDTHIHPNSNSTKKKKSQQHKLKPAFDHLVLPSPCPPHHLLVLDHKQTHDSSVPLFPLPPPPLHWRNPSQTTTSTLTPCRETHRTKQENTFGRTGACMKESGGKQKRAVKEGSRGHREPPMKESSRMVALKDSGYSSGCQKRTQCLVGVKKRNSVRTGGRDLLWMGQNHSQFLDLEVRRERERF